MSGQDGSSEVSVSSAGPGGGGEPSLQLLLTVFAMRGKIIRFTMIMMVLIAAGSFLIHNKYTATAVVLPDVDILSAAQKFSSLQDIATAAGLNLGVTSPSQLYPDIMESETILRKVMYHQYQTEKFSQPVNLIQYWKFDDKDSMLNYEACLKKLRENVVDEDVNRKTAIITLTVETTERRLSADIANQILSALDDYQRNFRRVNASEQRKYVEKRLQEVKTDLAHSEDLLKTFHENNRGFQASPELTMQEARLSRDVDVNTSIYLELTKQNELVKLDEIKNSPIVQVLDYARTPGEKSGPRRRVILMIGTLLSFGLAIGWYGGRNYLSTMQSQNPIIAEIMDGIMNTFNRKRREKK